MFAFVLLGVVSCCCCLQCFDTVVGWAAGRASGL